MLDAWLLHRYFSAFIAARHVPAPRIEHPHATASGGDVLRFDAGFSRALNRGAANVDVVDVQPLGEVRDHSIERADVVALAGADGAIPVRDHDRRRRRPIGASVGRQDDAGGRRRDRGRRGAGASVRRTYRDGVFALEPPDGIRGLASARSRPLHASGPALYEPCPRVLGLSSFGNAAASADRARRDCRRPLDRLREQTRGVDA